MSKSLSSRMPLYVRDMITPCTMDYLILLQESNLSFVRLGWSAKIEVLMQRTVSDSAVGDLPHFLRALRESGLYYGQPVYALVDATSLWSLASDIGNAAPGEALQRIRMLADEHTDIKHRVLNVGKRRVFVSQGIDKSIQQQIISACEEEDLYVTHIIGLSTALIRETVARSKQGDTVSLFPFPGGPTYYVVTSAKGDILFNKVQTESKNSTPKDIGDTLAQDFFDPDVVVESSYYSTATADGVHQLGRFLRQTLTGIGKLGALSYPTKDSQTARGLKIILNSFKLLSFILAAAFVLTGLFAAVTGLMSTGNTESLTTYQLQYNSKLSLEQTLESLRGEQASLEQRYEGNRHNAATLSAFCQRRLNAVHLDKIQLRNVPEGNTLVEVNGSAEDENAVFRYHEILSDIVAPYKLSINAIQPDITNSRGNADTTVTFKLSMDVNAGK